MGGAELGSDKLGGGHGINEFEWEGGTEYDEFDSLEMIVDDASGGGSGDWTRDCDSSEDESFAIEDELPDSAGIADDSDKDGVRNDIKCDTAEVVVTGIEDG